MVKNLPAIQETWVRFLSREDPLEKGIATHTSILAWRIPWTEEPDRLQYMELQIFEHDWAFWCYFNRCELVSLWLCLAFPEGLVMLSIFSCAYFPSVYLFVSCPAVFATPWTVACQGPLSTEFLRQEYWSGLPFPSPKDLHNPGIAPGSPALQADSLPSEL